ncbi:MULTISPECIES: polyprenyl synthetase family protein [Clostridium]|jgi:heptaprenyl diphosphate synthase|uniref:Heptaprenyl diphosphate synthase component 2 n=2 Tax=Clostridium TaxID=1485 RepID=A0A151APL5_9CLOT|nr:MULTISPECIES: polyprenyl synthetase family protein [Clostridium]KYH29579.1 heptaprenyl diphosphate synthase component 2 [Clostridium colicanis DSM 13634]MBE6043883.1 polyprenyl synthetase family protein [Clostridium thermopalmarium]PRR72028.1 Heptaprenyl diphosphate synthase component 2 [Clostridium thermopalmarium DSM 5974]PVZ23680.1 heptaprenyl diphosphate synthase [Clostridium thermopalmarium DSM 5974]
MDKIWDNYKDIKDELNNVISFMEKSVKCKDKKIENSIKELIHSGGKMLRPAFVIISSHFGNYDKEKTKILASVIEMLHMATLVHDDVIDDSKTRRGKETIQSKYGKDYAVYIGDFLFCVCFKILASSSSLQSIKIDSNSMSRICLGEINQLNSMFDTKLSVKDYLNRISGKTAELFSLSLYTGAAESGCSDALSKQFWKIGHNIGMAFQIIDDVLDYVGTDDSIKKPAASDLKQGIFTLPFIYAAKKNRNAFKHYLEKESFSDEDVKNIISLVNKYEGIKDAKELANKYTKKAFKLIDNLPENPYKTVLKEVAEKLLLRSY